MNRKIFLLLIMLAGGSSVKAQQYQPEWSSLDSRVIPAWFRDAKFGIFIHWGVYSVPAWRKVTHGLYASYAEWYYARVMNDTVNGGKAFHEKNYGPDFEYRDFAPMFRAELFNPDFWAEIFKNAGAKYVVLTSKHHDGFCLWPTASKFKKGWNSMDTGPKRDLLGELTRAVRDKGMKMGLYYSLPEWESIKTGRTKTGYFIDTLMVKKYRIPVEDFVESHVIPQLKELVTMYQPSLIFADGGEWDYGEDFWKTKELLTWLYNEAPNKDEVVVNDRFCKGMPGKHGDYFSSEYKDAEGIDRDHPWEESRGIGGSYGYNRDENIYDYSTSEKLIHELIEIVSAGGNLLLNVGPTADGRIPEIMQQRLLDIGGWLQVNGEAIYGTRRVSNDFEQLNKTKNVFFTRKADTLYILCTRWPTEEITIRGGSLSGKNQVTLLGYNGILKTETTDDKISITPPLMPINEIPCQYAWVFRLTGYFKNE